MANGRLMKLRLFLVICVVLGSCRLGGAHNGEYPPKPPVPAPPAGSGKIIHAVPPRWSWLHWWEANRDGYLKRIAQGTPDQNADQEATAKFRLQATEALLASLASERWQVRASAALALGRMGDVKALEPLKVIAMKDTATSVRMIALVSVGLLNTPEAEVFLRTSSYSSARDRQAAVIALGLITEPSPETITGLQSLLKGKDPALATLASWALRQHATDPATLKLLKNVLSSNGSPWLASDAILGLSVSNDPATVRTLAEILLATDRGKTLAAWKALEARNRHLLQLIQSLKSGEKAYDRAYEQYLQDHKIWAQKNPNASDPEPKKVLATKEMLVGVQAIYQNRLRGSAAIALGQIGGEKACQVLRQALKQKDDEYYSLYKGFTLISLGQQGDAKALPAMLELLNPRLNKRARKGKSKLTDPLRGYAAIALGLYIRPVITPQGQVDRSGYEKICQLLAQRMLDPKDTDEVRAAAAMALGLSMRTENLRYLQQVFPKAQVKDELLVGYTMLACGMLGDQNIITPTGTFLDIKKERSNTSGILARRAAVLSLGVFGSREGIPILLEAWHLNHYVNREVALAYSLCGIPSVAEPLIAILKNPKELDAQPFAARCLGEFFAKQRPERLSCLIRDSNYMMKNVKMIRFEALANEFLFNYLIPCFGDEWR